MAKPSDKEKLRASRAIVRMLRKRSEAVDADWNRRERAYRLELDEARAAGRLESLNATADRLAFVDDELDSYIDRLTALVGVRVGHPAIEIRALVPLGLQPDQWTKELRDRVREAVARAIDRQTSKVLPKEAP